MSKDFSSYQKKVISRYYDNRDQIDETRLGELVTNLYLAKPGSKQMEKLWVSAQETMERLKVPESRIAHVMSKKDAAILAEVVKELTAGTLKRSST
ncbi:hypothetical protein [Planctomicrobium piriforme]|uniref:Uncharacterized protein n=1 Tax=Planctomicrobium piriforme TaxID=1576369 RepID=A0A1I3CZW6_9PLAN|nr:hypothetical protein [Planctomicrobium piriforme]SFH80007.1 hypothetical protein SAMN05421753_10333 [Planctomicrobium piriforme]